ncbi:hypothetical protein [uncultured Tenacibaculum sp.]|uniref:hypothetical protein n=1 Tax=uncultured Tenacibaculum sp. TaxID=174713 RepID=UPI0026358F6C|nr:hypothetical protein [uncultured Tenacibaculum sp.]
MNQKLKQKAYQVLIDKIDVETFENELYQLVEKNELKSDSLLFDFVSIDFKSDNYEKEIFNLLKNSCSDDELLSFETYFLCLKLSNSEKESIILNLINALSKLYIEKGYEYDLLYEFYKLNDGIQSLDYDYYCLTEEQIISKARLFSEKVITKFNFYKENEDWDEFLNCIIEVEVDKREAIKPSHTLIKQNESLFSSTINLLKGMLGLR